MNFNRSQRETLNRLSLVCFGATSKWQKLLEKGQFNDPQGNTPNYEQLHTGLLGALKFRLMGAMSKADLTTIVASQFMTDDQPLNIQLVVPVDEELQKAFEELLEKLPTPKSDALLTKTVVADQTDNGDLTFDALAFISECVYLLGVPSIQEVTQQIFADYEYQVVQSLSRNNLK